MNCKNCKKHGCSLAGKNHEMSFECKAYIGKTNADRIRAMTDEELADWVWGVETSGRAYGPRGKKAWLDWLKKEVDSD